MTTPTGQPQPIAWQGDPARDLLIYRLIDLGRTALDGYFAEADQAQRYASWLRKLARQRKKAAGHPELLGRWQNGRGGEVRLAALPSPRRFLLALDDAAFTAEVALTYDPETGDLLAAAVSRFQGDMAAASGVAGWLADGLGLAGSGDDALEDLLLALPNRAATPGDRSAEPPAATALH